MSENSTAESGLKGYFVQHLFKKGHFATKYNYLINKEYFNFYTRIFPTAEVTLNPSFPSIAPEHCSLLAKY